jgi:hypothetical protein
MKLIIFNYKTPETSPDVIMATDDNRYINYQKSYEPVQDSIAAEAFSLIMRAWENGAWWFANKEYGLKQIDVSNILRFVSEIKEELNEIKTT